MTVALGIAWREGIARALRTNTVFASASVIWSDIISASCPKGKVAKKDTSHFVVCFAVFRAHIIYSAVHKS